MALSDLALGIASIAIGLNTLKKGLGHLSATNTPARKRLSFEGFSDAPPVYNRRKATSLPGRPFTSSGTKSVQGVPMQMRSYNIRTLEDRIVYLRRLVDAGKRDPHVYAFARRAVSKKCGNSWCTPEKDNLAEAKAVFGAISAGRRGATEPDMTEARNLFRSIRDNVRYTSDIASVDTYQKPSHTLRLKTADCDDFSTLTCAALQSLGIPCRFKVIRTKGANDWNHIFPEAGFPRANPTRWVSMDSSVNMPFGWQAPPKMVADSRVFRVG
jgi:transglutaminase-like putative cysteine protease